MKKGLTLYQNASHGLDNPKKAFVLLLTKGEGSKEHRSDVAWR
jgi:hypothetical protein